MLRDSQENNFPVDILSEWKWRNRRVSLVYISHLVALLCMMRLCFLIAINHIFRLVPCVKSLHIHKLRASAQWIHVADPQGCGELRTQHTNTLSVNMSEACGHVNTLNTSQCKQHSDLPQFTNTQEHKNWINISEITILGATVANKPQRSILHNILSIDSSSLEECNMTNIIHLAKKQSPHLEAVQPAFYFIAKKLKKKKKKSYI